MLHFKFYSVSLHFYWHCFTFHFLTTYCCPNFRSIQLRNGDQNTYSSNYPSLGGWSILFTKLEIFAFKLAFWATFQVAYLWLHFLSRFELKVCRFGLLCGFFPLDFINNLCAVSKNWFSIFLWDPCWSGRSKCVSLPRKSAFCYSVHKKAGGLRGRRWDDAIRIAINP